MSDRPWRLSKQEAKRWVYRAAEDFSLRQYLQNTERDARAIVLFLLSPQPYSLAHRRHALERAKHAEGPSSTMQALQRSPELKAEVVEILEAIYQYDSFEE